MVELINKKTSNYGSPRNHWSVVKNGKEIGQAGHGLEAWGRWSFLSRDGKTYETFQSKTALIGFASTYEVQQ